jgi:hypothetical protein
MKNTPSFHTWLAAVAWSVAAVGQAGRAGAAEGYSVTLGATIEPKRVPLNRTASLTVRLSWEGALDSVLVGEVVDPALSNLEIAGTSVTNRTVGTATGVQSIKEIVYLLRPKSLGMGYIDSLAVAYQDLKAGVLHTLKTPRLAVEAVQSVPERTGHSKLWLWIFLIAGFLAGTLGGAALFLRSKIRKPAEPEQVQRLLEETTLDELKGTGALHADDREGAFAALSKLFRQYLAAKYGIQALEATTPDLLAALGRAELDASLLRRCEAFFEKADLIKFSGQKASPQELDEAYTAVESVLESKCLEEQLRLRGEREAALRQRRENRNPIQRIIRRIS